MALRTVFSYYHPQRLLFSPMNNNFLTTLTLSKNRDIHIEEFFVDSIYSKTIDIIIKKIFIFYFKQCEAGHPDNGVILQVVFQPGRQITAPFYKKMYSRIPS